MSFKERIYPPFNIDKLEEAELRRYFGMVQLRMEEVTRSIVDGYGMPLTISEIKTIILDELTFNAGADFQNSKVYITINASVIIVLRILFDHLLSSNDLLPQLSNLKESNMIDYKAEFIVNPKKLYKRSKLNISINEDRYKASGILSDLCISFIFLHEFGHLLCGHVEALNQHCSSASLLEIFNKAEQDDMDGDLRQYWEFQADCVAAGLLSQYVDDIVNHSSSHQTWILKATGLKGEALQDIATHVAAMTLAALHVLFLYMDNCKFNVDVDSYHPPAQSRVLYIKDTFCDEVSKRWEINSEDIVKVYYDTYLEPFVSSLENLGLNVVQGFEDDHLDAVRNISRKLKYGSDLYRDYCREWSWLPVDEWRNPKKNEK